MSPMGNVVLERSTTTTAGVAEPKSWPFPTSPDERWGDESEFDGSMVLPVGYPGQGVSSAFGHAEAQTARSLLKALRRPVLRARFGRGAKSVEITWADLAGSTAYKLVPIAAPEEAGSSTDEFWLPPAVGNTEHLSWNEAFDRLDELSRLPANWDSYGADPISPNALARGREALFALRAEFEEGFGELFLPGNIVPIADGGLQLEWDRDGLYLEVEFTADEEIVYLITEEVGSSRKASSGENISIAGVVRLVSAFLHVSALCRITW